MNTEDEKEDFVRQLDLACADMLACEQNEPHLAHFFSKKPAGAWLHLKDVKVDPIYKGLFATWLRLPDNRETNFVLVIFLHEESGWTMTATYNVGRLFRIHPQILE
ncbi:MAG: hypothetical protein R6X02_09075 [Enhygromyxa sp.]